MCISALLNDFRMKFKNHGTFDLAQGESILAAVKGKVPDEYGIYVISSITPSKIVYFGKAGTVANNGQMKEQGLLKRLTNKQGKVSRVKFFKMQIEEKYPSGLHFEWFVTFDGHSNSVLPVLAEAQLLQAYFSEHGGLPDMNASA